MIDTTVTGQRVIEESGIVTSGEIGPKTTGSGPIPPYQPSSSGLLKEYPKIVIGD